LDFLMLVRSMRAKLQNRLPIAKCFAGLMERHMLLL
jgi:hypothetical protein